LAVEAVVVAMVMDLEVLLLRLVEVVVVVLVGLRLLPLEVRLDKEMLVELQMVEYHILVVVVVEHLLMEHKDLEAVPVFLTLYLEHQ
jgi:hypothetical protein